MTDIASAHQEITLGAAASLHYYKNFISPENSAALLERWQDELNWVQSEISLFGKKIPIPRLNAWYGDHAYSYSGTHFKPQAWPPSLLEIKNKLQRVSKLNFNSVLVNWYRDGNDSMGWHSDDEASLGPNPQIASVSIGEQRKFVLRQIQNKSNKHALQLEDGSLLLMLGETQSRWQHSVPRTVKSKHSRINLTFRQIQQL